MEPDDRELLIEILNRSGVDYDASEQDSVLIETNEPNVFAEFRFWPGNGRLSNVAVQNWNGVRDA
jgi:hypothetical protein